MDLMADLNRIRYSAKNVQARKARAVAREEAIYSKLGLALGKESALDHSNPELDALAELSRVAAGWNLSNEPANDGASIGNQHPGAAAIMIVRKVLADYDFPSEIRLAFKGVSRAQGHGAFHTNEGVATIQATLQSMSGPRHFVDIPVIIRRGRVLAPSIVVHNGNPRVITQNTFDDILGMGEFTAGVPDRKNMYSPSPDKHAGPPRQVPKLSPGMFSPTPSRLMIASAVHGLHVATQSKGASLSDLDPERVAMRMAQLCEHDIKLGSFDSWDDVANSVYRDAAMEYVRSIDSGRRANKPLEAVQAEVKAFGDEVVKLVLAELKNDLDLEQHFGKGYTPKQAQEDDSDTHALEEAFRQMSPLQGQIVDQIWWLYDESGRINAKELKRDFKATPDVMERLVELGYFEPTNAGWQATKKSLELAEALQNYRRRRQAFYQPDVTGIVADDAMGRDVPGADRTHIDVGERKHDKMFLPGQTVTMKVEGTTRSRGGASFKIPKGSRGVVVRDVDGAAFAYYVKFDELGFSCVVPANGLAAGR